MWNCHQYEMTGAHRPVPERSRPAGNLNVDLTVYGSSEIGGRKQVIWTHTSWRNRVINNRVWRNGELSSAPVGAQKEVDILSAPPSLGEHPDSVKQASADQHVASSHSGGHGLLASARIEGETSRKSPCRPLRRHQPQRSRMQSQLSCADA
jgi:hypothetical protein